MAEKILLHDFIEIDYTGKFLDGTVFDTTNKETAEKNDIFSPQMNYKPAIICLGEKQLIEGLDSALLNKETEKTYTLQLKPEEAFGKKDFKKIPQQTDSKKKIAPKKCNNLI